MSKTIPGNHKHMTQDNRVTIEKGLDTGTSLRFPRRSKSTGPCMVTIPLMSLPTNVPCHMTAKESSSAVTAGRPARSCAMPALTVTVYVLTLSRNLTTVTCWIELPLSATAVAKRVTAGWINTTTKQHLHSVSTGPFWWNPVRESISPKRILKCWMSW